MKNILLLLTAVLFTIFYSCRSRTDPEFGCIYEEGIVEGTILGSAWTLGEGKAETQTDGFQIYLFDTNENPSADLCARTGLTGTHVTFFVDNVMGPQIFQQVSVYNATANEFDSFSTTCVEIVNITSTMIEGKVSFSANGNEVDGSFTATRC